MPFEHDDLGLRIIGYNQPIRFYDNNRTLRAEIFLQSDNTLNVGGISGTGSTGSTGTSGPHGLGDLAIHTGTLNDVQGPQFLKLDGSRPLTGNLAVNAGVTIDGVDVSAHASRHHSGGADAMDHGSMAGLSDDDHPQYGALAQNEDVTGAWNFQATLDTYDILPATTDSYDLGSSTKLWRKGYLSELETVIFALNTVTISGARQVWGHNAGTLGAALANTDTTCDFGQAMAVGDWVEMRAYGQVEYFLVGANVSGTVYKIGADGSGARNLDGSGANTWPAGTPYLVLGAEGDARIEINADGPKLQMLEQGATYDAATEYVRIGNMRNAFGVGANDYWGIGLGDYAGGNYLKYDDTGGFEMKAGDGGVTFDTNGISINQGAASYLRWMNGASEVCSLYFLESDILGSDLVFYNNGAKSSKYFTFSGGSVRILSSNLYVDGGIHIGGTADPGDNNLIVDGTATIAGTAYIGDTTNANATLGLTINQGAADDEILALKSSDVAHGMTDVTETDTYGTLTKSQNTSGGLTITGFKDGDGIAGHALGLNGRLGMAADTAKTTSAYGVVVLTARIKSGTGVADVGSNGNLVTIRNSATTRFIFDAEGSAHADVEWTTFDDYDDVALLTDLERAMLAQRDPVKAGFVDFLQYNHDALEAAGIVHFDRDNPGHAMVNTTKLSMALVGAIRQTNARMDALEARMLTG